MDQRLTLLVQLHKACQEKEKYMRSKQLALMRERNLYLDKIKKIEGMGSELEWKDQNGLLPQIYYVIARNSTENAQEFDDYEELEINDERP